MAMKKGAAREWESYRGHLSVAYVIATLVAPSFYKAGFVPCLILWGVSGLLFGTGFYLLEAIVRRVRLRSFVLQAALHALLMLLTVAIAMGTVAIIGAAVITGHSPFDKALISALFGSYPWTVYAGFLLAALVLGTILNGAFALRSKLGPSVFHNWITGKYYRPLEEVRVFMFLDMRDSTALAEQLGTLKFSGLVRDFFADLTEPLRASGAEVSHYIGDEAVIYWRPERAKAKLNCLELFFKFEAALEERRSHYEKTYGLMPEFKAGLHWGPVVAAEVGEVKSEIVFHGDVLNTCARLQGLCGELGEKFLASRDAADLLGEMAAERFVSKGLQQLKGKESQIEVMAVRPAPHN